MSKFKRSLAALVLISSLFCLSAPVFADEAEESSDEIDMSAATSISLTPVSKILTIDPSTVYEDSFKVTNNGTSPMNFEVYASPYSFATSTTNGNYALNFNTQTAFTQISRWITFEDQYGNWVETTKFTAQGGESITITYRISTPENLPDGGQYAVIFAHTIADEATTSGIKTEASPGIIVYGRSSTGETIRTAEVSDLKIFKSASTSSAEGSSNSEHITATANVKNTGNIDFTASATMKVQSIFGGDAYETSSNNASLSIIPGDTEDDTIIVMSDEWEETPALGIFKVTWTIVAADQNESISQTICILPFYVIIIAIIVLTGIIFSIILTVKKRKERRSRTEA